MQKPKVFLSSTIHDFRDLRSAIRVWLEEYGFEVQASEFNDFPQIPDSNSYESCLKAIDESNYFILLVGSRVGGLYDAAKKISITRMEYQHAYERLKAGKLKMLVFVRKEVWDIREDRTALRKYIEDNFVKEGELDADQAAKLVAHSSRFLTDAESTFDFLAEIGKHDEMKQATKGQGAFPVGNWMYQFAGFKDITDALRTVLGVSGGLRKVALVASLQHEIEENLVHFFTMTKDGHLSRNRYGASHSRKCLQGGMNDGSQYKGEDLRQLGAFVGFHGKIGIHLRSRVLEDAILSGEFLELEKATGKFVVGKIQRGLMTLLEVIDRLRLYAENEPSDSGTKLIANPSYMKSPIKMFTVPNIDLISEFYFYDVWENAENMFKAIHRALDGDSTLLDSVKINPTSPIACEAANIQNETPAISAIQWWIAQG